MDRISRLISKLEKEGEKIDHSDLAREVDFRIESSDVLKRLFSIIDLNANKEEGIMNNPILLQNIQDFIKQTNQVENGIVNLSGNIIDSFCSSKNIFQVTSKLLRKIDRLIVKDIGHFFGKKFKPWEAVKLTSKIGKAVPLLNLVGVGFDIYSTNKDKQKKEEANLQLAQFKNEIRNLLDDAVSKTSDDVSQKLLKPVEIVLGDTYNAN